MLTAVARPRLGSLLLERGAIGAMERERALHLQHQMGMRLGSNLLELGALAESALLEGLGLQHRHATVDGDRLARVPRSVLNQIPAAIAIEHGVVPFSLDGGALWVATADPLRPAAEQALLEACARPIRSELALEIRILEALHRCYGLPITPRAESLVRRLDSFVERRGMAVERRGMGGATAARVEAAESLAALTSALDTQSTTDPPWASETASAAPRWRPRRLGRLGKVFERLDADPLSAVIEHEDGEDIAYDDPPGQSAGLPDSRPRTPGGQDAPELGTELLDGYSSLYRFRILLRLVDERVVAWLGDGDGVVPRRLAEIDFALDSSPLFLRLAAHPEPWTGAIGNDLGLATIASSLGTSLSSFTVLPVATATRIFGFLFLAGGLRPDAPELPVLRRLRARTAQRLIELDP